MGYAELVELLARDLNDATVTALPDGSVDRYYAVRDIGGDTLDSRVAFGERIADGDSDSFPVERVAREPGGRAVNMARQADALGDETTLFGHVDDPVFDDLRFEAVSMGTPARVAVYDFDDDLMIAENSADVEGWSLSDLRAVADSFERRLTADAVCCGNWASVDAMTDALADLAAANLDGNLFVIDPGNLTTRPHEAVVRLFETLGDLNGSYEVVFSANRIELEYSTDALSIDGETDATLVERLREESTITGVVVHGVDHAIAGTAEGAIAVPNLAVDDPTRQTGAGDRFGAGLAHALVRGRDWETALALGNLCASYYVDTGETGTKDDLVVYLRDRDEE